MEYSKIIHEFEKMAAKYIDELTEIDRLLKLKDELTAMVDKEGGGKSKNLERIANYRVPRKIIKKM